MMLIKHVMNKIPTFANRSHAWSSAVIIDLRGNILGLNVLFLLLDILDFLKYILKNSEQINNLLYFKNIKNEVCIYSRVNKVVCSTLSSMLSKISIW